MNGRTQSFRFETPDEEALFHERAAIREYDGGVTRAAAERLAVLDVLDARRLRDQRAAAA